jgi:hypothetical protein
MTLVISKGLTLDNGTRAAAIAGVSPTLDYRFAREKREIETVSLTDKLTYTGGNGTFTGSDGFIQRATTNVPRFDHDPLSRQSLGLLSEGSKQNLLLRSKEFNDASWVKTQATVMDSAIASPSGDPTALKITETTVNSGHFVEQAFTGTAGTYCTSIFAKAGERTFVRGYLIHSDGIVSSTISRVNLITGAVVSGNAIVQSTGNGWYRISISGALNGTSMRTRWLLSLENTDVYAGDGTSGLFLWGAQLEAGSFPSTYIPTTTAAVTRTADSAVIDGTGVLAGTYTLVEKPAGCAVVSGTNINLEPGFTAERVMVFPAALDAGQITAIRGAM